jgi:hypothetical protein
MRSHHRFRNRKERNLYLTWARAYAVQLSHYWFVTPNKARSAVIFVIFPGAHAPGYKDNSATRFFVHPKTFISPPIEIKKEDYEYFFVFIIFLEIQALPFL